MLKVDILVLMVIAFLVISHSVANRHNRWGAAGPALLIIMLILHMMGFWVVTAEY